MDDIELERFLEDEKLAMVLQNEEFIRELRHNRDFMSSLEKGLLVNDKSVLLIVVSISLTRTTKSSNHIVDI